MNYNNSVGTVVDVLIIVDTSYGVRIEIHAVSVKNRNSDAAYEPRSCVRRNNGDGRGDQADTSGVAQAARGVPHHAAGRRADRAETDAEKRLLAVAVVVFAEPEPTVVDVVVAAHIVPAGRLPRADRRQEQRADTVARGTGQEA